jgi:hypothetical protein
MKTKIVTLIYLITATVFAQDSISNHKTKFPIWTFHQNNVTTHGLSLGLASWEGDKPRNVNTNGIKIEAIGLGLLVPLIPKSPVVETDSSFVKLKKEPLSEKINGVALSASGTVCNCLTNGISAGFLGQINSYVNGVSAILAFNFSQKNNGLMLAAFNDAYIMNGLQLGFSNNGFKSKGLQVGILSNSNRSISGMQLGTYNKSENLKGIQIGIFNVSEKTRGLQIGFWNINEKRSLPFINW